jgi:uncharacterized membrane protein YeaQ/YmgE (transglycosylase-associated protein family)
MGVISWIILGVLAGWLCGKFVSNKPASGFLQNVVLGIVGACVGGVLANLIGLGGVSGVNLWSLLIATGGAVVVTIAYNSLTGQNR